ncbi:lung seven transmembrane receptor-domain-containing protein [Limtongia smithiae]|uniref:lung seven transmembrane receptor-domain-containing protein n=1 Tax=Limtongia smithiae TaxID=1125753 RepID=UPI0034CE1526
MTVPHSRVLAAVLLLALLALFARGADANEAHLANKPTQRQQCSGMYSRRDWSGNIDPYIQVTLQGAAASDDVADPAAGDDDITTRADSSSAIVSLVIFEWADVDCIGVLTQDTDMPMAYVCDDEALSSLYCRQEQYGQFLITGSLNGSLRSIYTRAVGLPADGSYADSITYEVQKSGFYCVGTYGMSTGNGGYHGTVLFQNAFGKLPASQIAKLPFYGGLALAYLVVLAFWMFLYVQYRSDILAVQNYITACAAFLAIEMLVLWGYYDLINASGNTVFTRVYMVFVAILNAFRNAFTFFLLLIVCMGYGVVRPSLGGTMLKCRILAGLHFVFGVLYVVSSFLITPDTAGPLVLLVILPLAASMTAFYLWILSSLNGTIRDLVARKQNVKALMYRRLWRLLFTSIIIIFGFFFLNSLIFADRNAIDFVPRHWKSRWFVLDGWLNVVYFLDFIIIAFLWRPTKNNRRFAMSDELAQEDDMEGGQAFEIASLAGSLDDDEEDERVPAYDTPRGGRVPGAPAPGIAISPPSPPAPAAATSRSRSVSPVPLIPAGVAASTAAPSTAHGAGVTSETLFEAPSHVVAGGDDADIDVDYDRWSEDDELDSNLSDDAGATLTKKKGKDE